MLVNVVEVVVVLVLVVVAQTGSANGSYGQQEGQGGMTHSNTVLSAGRDVHVLFHGGTTPPSNHSKH